MQFSAIFNPIFTGAATSATSRWTAVDFIDRVLFATPSVPPLYWAGAGEARQIPGLPDFNGYDGIGVFDGKVFVWRGDLLKWSDRGDFSSWIPVSATAASGRATLESDFSVPPTGSSTGHVYLDNVVGEFYVGQFVRIVTNGQDPTSSFYDYFRVRGTALGGQQYAKAIKSAQTVPVGTEKTRIYLGRYDTHVAWTTGSRLTIGGIATQLRVVGRSRNSTGEAQLDQTGSSPIPRVGGPILFNFAAPPDELQSGDVVSVGPSREPGQNLYLITVPPSYQIRATRLGFGNRTADTFVQDTWVTFQNWVEVENGGTDPVAIAPGTDVVAVSSLILEPLGFTGGTPVGMKIPVAAEVESIDTNESGELRNVGASINGDIYAVVTLAEFAYILKNHSIQSVQSVGASNGTFFLRTEFSDEGLVGRYAWCRAGSRALALWGTKGFYLYSGGQNLQPVAEQHYRAVRDELDRSRSDEIIAYHNARDKEVWFLYPTLQGQTKAFVFNYEAGSAVTDRYPDELHGITAAAAIAWELAPTWESLPASEVYTGAAKRWYEYVDEGEVDRTVLAIGGDAANADLGETGDDPIPRLLVHGRVWHRSSRDDCETEGSEYTAAAETPDFDFGDPAMWKYVDTVFVTLNQRPGQPEDAVLEISVGARDNLNSPLRWSPPQQISLQEAGSVPTKINTTMSGRYIRIRFSSSVYDSNWAITSYQITARRGGTY